MNRKLLLFATTLLFTGVLLESCYKDKGDLLYPTTTTCDTTSIVSYSSQVVPIVSNYCYACHNTANYLSVGGNLNLEGYNNIIIPIQSGKLVKSINHEAGVSPMPKNSPMLSTCNIKTIETWISQGIKNN